MAHLNSASSSHTPQTSPSLASGSSAPSRPLKRKRSLVAMNASLDPAPSRNLSPIIVSSIHQEPDGLEDSCPSPAPTEIIEPEPSSEELMAAAIATGVKGRDFAYETPRKPDIRAREVWKNPLDSLTSFDYYIRTDPVHASGLRLSGKALFNLRAAGWITDAEAQRHFRSADWEAVKAYEARPYGPYPCGMYVSAKRPTRAYRLRLLQQASGHNEFHIGENEIYMPEDEPGMDDGPLAPPVRVRKLSRPPSRAPVAATAANPSSHKTPVASTSAAVAAAPVEPAGGDARAHKRRRVASGPSTIPARSPSASTRTTHGPATHLRSDTPPLTAPPSPSSRMRSASGSRPSSQSSTPPPEESRPPPPMRGLGRTQTLAGIWVR